MFIVRADYSKQFEVNANVDKVQEFFADIKNFIELMPSIESIQTDNRDITHWRIRADVPFIGSFVEKFAVHEKENNGERIEWASIEGERFNLMKYAADFFPREEELTLVQFAQIIELRRKSATDLHLLAGFAGESLISNEMSRQIGEMLKTFIEKACQRLES
jgi:carbon monoxide dehydrogenase subunit G